MKMKNFLSTAPWVKMLLLYDFHKLYLEEHYACIKQLFQVYNEESVKDKTTALRRFVFENEIKNWWG